MFDKVIVAVLMNENKRCLFTIEERVQHLKQVLKDSPEVEIDCFSGLLVDYMKQKGAGVVIRGLRAVTDFEYEFQMALLNKKMEPSVETFFMMTNIKYSFLSSSAVKEIARHGGCVKDLVPDLIAKELELKFGNGLEV